MAKNTPELTKTTIFDASTAEIVAFAEKFAGLEFNEGADRSWIIEQVFEAMEWDAYRPEEDATHVEVMLAKTKDNKHPYRGGFNGRSFSIKRGENVTIPIGYYNTMIDAASRAYTLECIGKGEEVKEGSPASRRLPVGALDISVKRFINKGKPAEPAKPAPKEKAKEDS
jgi:hypothetical protein